MLFGFCQIPFERQRNVGRALAITLGRDRTTPLTERAMQTGRDVVAATQRLQDPPAVEAIVVDVSMDTVLTATHRILRAWSRAFAGELVCLEPQQQDMLEAARFLLTKWFPHGVGFVREQMSLEWDALRPIAASFDELQVSEGKPKALSAKVEHRDNWQDAMKTFAITVLADNPVRTRRADGDFSRNPLARHAPS
jgi:hypothetical protein